MSYTAIIFTKKDHIAHITLNRLEANNIINHQLVQELDDVYHKVNQDDDVYVVVVTGAGDSVFCAGSELEQQLQTPNIKSAELKEIKAECSAATAIASIDRPVIVAINGDAIGQGLELALACDIRLASQRARFGLPQVTMGAIPIDGGTQRLPRIVGKGKALELLLTAATISAEEAFEIGLVSKVVAHEDLPAEVEALARAIAAKGPVALRYAKEAVNKGLDLTLEQGLHLEADLYAILHTTADRTEGIKAFLQKRPPRFEGK
ncbi:enoyl-CoA hydratase/isomerase family protein [Chloroflexota bacterium]